MPTWSTVAYLWWRIESEHQQPKKNCDSKYGMCLHLMRHFDVGALSLSVFETEDSISA